MRFCRRSSGDDLRAENIIGTFRDPVTGNTVNIAPDCSSAGATSKAAAATTSSSIPIIASSAACAAICSRASPTTRHTSTATSQLPIRYLNDFSISRLTNAVDVIDNPADAGRRSDVPIRFDGHRSELRPVRHLHHRRRHSGGAQLPAGAGLPARNARGDDCPRRHDHRGRRIRAEDAVGRRTASDSTSAPNIARKHRISFPTSRTRPAILRATVERLRRSAASSTYASSSPRRKSRSSSTTSSISCRSAPATATRTTRSPDNTFNTTPTRSRLEFAPIRDVRFRASYNRAVRAPNIVELFTPQGVALAGTSDPVRRRRRSPTATLAQCQLTGVTAAQYGNRSPRNPANQYNGLLGGNPDLQSGEGGQLYGRRGHPAALHSGPRADRRLLQHQGEERHRSSRRTVTFSPLNASLA